MLGDIHKYLLVPKYFLQVSGIWVNSLYLVASSIIGYALTQGLVYAPLDQTQGSLYKIIYIHVPIAALSLSLYLALALMSAVYWVWQIKMADIAATACAFIGALTTLLALATGAVWGKPTWGTWWIWDARLTTEFILLLLYLGVLSVRFTLRPSDYAKKMAAICATLGLIDVPLVHYSVQWWYTLHQGPTLFMLAKPKIAWVMLWPLLIALFGFGLLSAALVLQTMRLLIKNDYQQDEYTLCPTLS